MILCRLHGFEVLAVYERENAYLRAGQELLDDNACASAAERTAVNRVLDGCDRVLFGHGNRHAFAERQAVRLDDDRRTLLLDIGNGIRRVFKHGIACGRDAVLFHQFLGKGLGAFDDCRVFTRAKGTDTRFFQRVDHAERQRVVRRDHHEVRLVRLGKGHYAVNIGRLDVDTFRFLRDAAVAGRAPDMVDLGALFQGMDDGMLTAAAADHQYFHGSFPSVRMYSFCARNVSASSAI